MLSVHIAAQVAHNVLKAQRLEGTIQPTSVAGLRRSAGRDDAWQGVHHVQQVMICVMSAFDIGAASVVCHVGLVWLLLGFLLYWGHG